MPERCPRDHPRRIPQQRDGLCRSKPSQPYLGSGCSRNTRRQAEGAAGYHGEFSETDITWSKDASKIYFTSERVREPYYESNDNDIYVVNASGGEITKVASIDGPIRQLSLSPDGGRIAFVGAINRGGGFPERSYSQPDLFVGGSRPARRRRI